MRGHLFLSSVLLFLPLTVWAANFSDVHSSNPHALAIQNLKEAQIIQGYSDGTFKPDQPVSRAEAVAIILKAAGIVPQKSALKLPFTDVPQEAWFFPVIQTGVSFGKLKGYEDKTFRPDKSIALPEAVAFTLSIFNIETKGIKLEATIYEGLDRLAWYAKRMQYAKNQNLIEPDENGYINAIAQLSRAKLAELVYRMRLVHQTGKPFDITTSWVTTEYLENFWKIKHPVDWEVFKGQKNSVIWQRDRVVGTSTHVFFTRLWPASARLSLSLVENSDNLTALQYFARLKEAYEASYRGYIVNFSEQLLSGRPSMQITIPLRRIIDVAISLPNKNFLIIYGEYGDAPRGEFLKKQMEAILQSYQFVEKSPSPPPPPLLPLAERMEMLREKILEPNQWKEIGKLFPDKKLIHTDAIGIGTGPVDYYYSKEANHTIKVERKSRTILNIREGETKGF